ncbi:DUF11 domain-containing protein [Nannocystis bainbridge]|uniref:DUF11 domain-containing protein n=1 Tax=Nannocystis bainbridge TaxID=2995303 RepID=A0ABT5DWE0_9BACT|nr:DUF11 domain-containing protein [Nannocystis bainbridge]MDC0716731.1 DUF11 domain-containing protein [Nannocystis bainbridge]
MTSVAALGVGLLIGGSAGAAPLLRAQIVQRGDFVLVGNTLAHDCSPATPAPLVGKVGNCGAELGDGAADVLWRADSPVAGAAAASVAIEADDARSSAVLLLPPGARPTHAFLYWAAQLAIAGADSTVVLERPGFLDVELSADACYVSADGSYVCSVDVGELVIEHGPGLFRVGGVEVRPFQHLLDEEIFAAWWLVVVYERPFDPLRSIGVYEGLDAVLPLQPCETAFAGFVVPKVGVGGTLAVAGLAGDHGDVGDQLLLADVPLGDALNPIDDFFNGTRGAFGFALSVVGDLPRLSGLPASGSGLDLDIVDITARLDPLQTSLPMTVTTAGDAILLATTVVSITTAAPNLEIVETVEDLSGGAFVPGDVAQYTIEVTNVGNDDAVEVVLTDTLPAAVTFVPGTLEVVGGPGFLSDVALDDEGEAIEDELVVRLGVGADEEVGGSLAIDASTLVRFQVVIDDEAEGIVSHQATVTAAGLLGASADEFLSEAPLEFLVEECDEVAPCPFDTPLCDLGPVPNVCVECLDDLDCGPLEVCDPLTSACACEAAGPELCDGLDNDCNELVDDGFDLGASCSTGLGECLVEGALVCDGLGGVACDAVAGPPADELCDGLDNDCDGEIDGACTKCLADAECGGLLSGRVCYLGVCVDGCRAVGNFCPLGLECSSDDASPGECLDPEAGEDEAPPVDELEDLADDEKVSDLLGCDCDGRPGDRDGPLLLALAALAGSRRRRRR